ncbi:senescence associated gene 20-like, partial [Gastrolobium bilobum]|uniref:senescence associated gene 20-like n=1 Tax=Gastrolobium bilobum TaxID=150636 RepID=UPI002AAF5F8C
ELANSQEHEDADSSNQRLVLTLYDALSSLDSDTVVTILAPHLDWWFHGPPSHQFLMRLLTGHSSSFRFVPQSLTSFGPTVLVEGCDTSLSISWVHAWTVTNGVITHLREYLNTSLTVTRIADSSDITAAAETSPSLHCPSVWESTVSDRVGKSVPGLILTI